MHALRLFFTGVATIGSLSALGFYALAIAGARHFLRAQLPVVSDAALPSVSILKPLKGIDPELYGSFRSHCAQDYPRYEIIFGVSASDDPAAPLVERLRREFPELPIKLIVCSEALGTNRKVGNLAQMLAHARYGHVIVNDSDIRVSPCYLRNIMSAFSGARVGMVTAPYIGAPGAGLWSRLEALGIATDFIPGVLAAHKLEGGIRFGLGSTLAMSRAALDQIGGFAPLIDYLGDDYELGARIAQAGYEVVLAREVVQTFLPDYGFVAFWQHQLRWSRAVRASRTGGYLGLAFSFGIFWSLLTMLIADFAVWSICLLIVVWVLRFGMAHYVAGSVLRDRVSVRLLWLLPIRDLLAVPIWIGALWGNTVVWRGERFRLRRGRLERLSPPGV